MKNCSNAIRPLTNQIVKSINRKQVFLLHPMAKKNHMMPGLSDTTHVTKTMSEAYSRCVRKSIANEVRFETEDQVPGHKQKVHLTGTIKHLSEKLILDKLPVHAKRTWCSKCFSIVWCKSNLIRPHMKLSQIPIYWSQITFNTLNCRPRSVCLPEEE